MSENEKKPIIDVNNPEKSSPRLNWLMLWGFIVVLFVGFGIYNYIEDINYDAEYYELNRLEMVDEQKKLLEAISSLESKHAANEEAVANLTKDNADLRATVESLEAALEASLEPKTENE